MFQRIKANIDNPVGTVYLSNKTRNNQNSVIYKLNHDYSGDGSHISKMYNEYVKGTRNFATRLKRFMSRTKNTNSNGYIFEFIRLFRGYYEITDIVDQYTVGYMVASKNDVIKFFGRNRMTNGLVQKTHVLMNERLKEMNNNYSIAIAF